MYFISFRNVSLHRYGAKEMHFVISKKADVSSTGIDTVVHPVRESIIHKFSFLEYKDIQKTN